METSTETTAVAPAPADTAAVSPATDAAAPAISEATGEHQSIDPNAGQTEQKPDAMGFFSSPLFLLLVGVWALFIFSSRKQKKKAQERKDQLSGIKKGDKVVTIGRIHGEVVALAEKTITLKVDKKGTELTFDREAVLAVPSQEMAPDAEAKS